MSEIKHNLFKIATLEELTYKNTPIHRLDPAVKLITTVIFLIVVISYGPDQVSSLIPYFFYTVILMAFGEIPWKPLLQRLLITLPFASFAAISNLIFNRNYVIFIGQTGITSGMVSFCSIVLKMILTVMAVLILIATTGMNELFYAMLKLHLPSILVLQIMMTFRYLGVLTGEATVMYQAYLLRAPGEKRIRLKDMGPFLGQLLIRSFDRAERIYYAMKCRGFEGRPSFSKNKKISGTGWIYMVMVSGVLIVLRFINLSEFIGRFIV